MSRWERLLYRLACWWLDSPRVERARAYVEAKARTRWVEDEFWHCTMGCQTFPRDTEHDDCPACGHPLIRTVETFEQMERELLEP